MKSELAKGKIGIRADVENSPKAVLIVGGDGKIAYCNSRVEVLFGLSTDQLIDHDFTEFLHPRKRFQESFPAQYRTYIVVNDGRLAPVRLETKKVSWNNQPANIITLNDACDLNWLENFIQAHAEVFEGIGECVTITDSDQTILFTSRSFLEASGLRKEDIIGHANNEFFTPEVLTEELKIRNRVFVDGKAWQGEVAVRYPHGRSGSGWAYVKPVFHEKGTVIGSICVMVDIRERQQPQADGKPGLVIQDQLKELHQRLGEIKIQLGSIGQALSLNTTEEPQTGHSRKGFPRMATRARLEVCCLGPLRVCSSDRQIQHWPGKRARSVFEHLVKRPGTPVNSDVLMEALWPNHDRDSAASNLRTAVHHLRKSLGQIIGDKCLPSVLFSWGSYLLNPELEWVLDVDEFEEHYAKGMQLEKEKKTDTSIMEYEQAESLYHGDYLEDNPYEEWTLSRREYLKDKYLLVLSKLANHCLSTTDYERCIIYCQKILSRDTCREDIYRLLMRCYSRLGQGNRAIQWYKTCRQTLKAELHVSPDRKIIDLYRKLLAGEEI
jgi:PAS domain S-box-containing protein